MIGISKIKAVRRGGLTIASGVLLVAAFALPSTALAKGECSKANSDPTAAQYCSPAGTHGGNNSAVKGASGAGGNETSPATEVSVEPAPATEATAVTESSSSSLPFTGLDVGVLAAVAVALAGTGLFLRRLSAPRDTRS